ncbi:hypothetical protein HH214_07425 [Mucilaginibacter robiniae]|uniref:QacE n=1 Tax=Mucilaginibacter robiniae TaxID=2728022 RepID=A0A7L5E4F8_9SPHI|nr:DUF6232 family protein [Mucilaginibacter robiniae]QJD95713.1 hypothetical protein HH214_07425 [Mucilaginibacter robiniae]
METNLQNEITFYQDSQVTITQARFVTDSKTYAMRNISSVHLFEIIKSKKLPIVMIIIGAALLLSDDSRWIGILLAAAGALAIALMKNDFAVRISTNSGEANSIVSKDRLYIQGIVDALNEAIIHRG